MEPSPDLDPKGSRRWGLFFLWEPYRLLHRGASHSYLYGLLSLAYLGLLPAPLFPALGERERAALWALS